MACFSIVVIGPEDAAFNNLFKKQNQQANLMSWESLEFINKEK